MSRKVLLIWRKNLLRPVLELQDKKHWRLSFKIYGGKFIWHKLRHIKNLKLVEDNWQCNRLFPFSLWMNIDCLKRVCWNGQSFLYTQVNKSRRQLVSYSAENYISNIYIIALSFQSTDCNYNVPSHAFDIFSIGQSNQTNNWKTFS